MATTIPPRFHVMAKPTGAMCNLDCSYCFFLDKEALYPDSDFRMNDEVLEAYIRQIIGGHRSNQVTVAWQGGEPTIMGVAFFRRAIAYQERCRRPGMTFENTMQTNGTLLTDEWCEFYKEHDFLIGISIDGPRELHDANRVDKGGRPTFDKVMRGLRLLQKHGVEFNVLTTVNAANGDHPVEVYRFLRDDVGTTWMQFIPIVERVNPDGRTLVQAGSDVSERSVGSEQWGRFLSGVFDEWVRNDVGNVFVQTIEATARNFVGMHGSGMCVFDETCGNGLAIEHNGDLYSCDHFVEPGYLLGNVVSERMVDLIGSDFQRKFGADKRDALPNYCRECDVLFACRGECPKNRFIATPDGEPGLNYLCAGYKAFFHHVDGPMRIMKDLMRRGLEARHVMGVLAQMDAKLAASGAGRTEPCPCGSGRKFKKCHGALQMAAAGSVGGS